MEYLPEGAATIIEEAVSQAYHMGGGVMKAVQLDPKQAAAVEKFVAAITADGNAAATEGLAKLHEKLLQGQGIGTSHPCGIDHFIHYVDGMVLSGFDGASSAAGTAEQYFENHFGGTARLVSPRTGVLDKASCIDEGAAFLWRTKGAGDTDDDGERPRWLSVVIEVTTD